MANEFKLTVGDKGLLVIGPLVDDENANEMCYGPMNYIAREIVADLKEAEMISDGA